MKEKKFQQIKQKYNHDYYEQLYANKLDNLEEMNKFLKACNLPRLNQEEIENLDKWITSNVVKFVI